MLKLGRILRDMGRVDKPGVGMGRGDDWMRRNRILMCNRYVPIPKGMRLQHIFTAIRPTRMESGLLSMKHKTLAQAEQERTCFQLWTIDVLQTCLASIK